MMIKKEEISLKITPSFPPSDERLLVDGKSTKISIKWERICAMENRYLYQNENIIW